MLTFPCISCFAAGVEALLAAKVLLKHGKISSDKILIADEKYLMQEAKTFWECYIDANECGDYYRGVIAFVINGLEEQWRT